MTAEDRVACHYTTGALTERIGQALLRLGIDADRVRPEDLKPVDEFHIGGAEATRALIDQIDLPDGAQVLDIGSGLGGTARLLASRGANATGLDLTPEFVETARALSAMVGLSEATRFEVGSALAMPFADASFDAATMIHVGMNLPDKPRLFAEAARVLRPRGVFAVYDVMRVNDGALTYPVPWAMTPETSFLAGPGAYRAAAQGAGFTVIAERERRGFALEFFAEMRARMARMDGPPPLSLDLVMGPTAPEKIANMIANIEAGLVAPVEMICRKDG